jgi:hypothetical protein
MNSADIPRLRLAAWLIIAAFVTFLFVLLTVGRVLLRTPEFNALTTVPEVAAYAAEHRASWISTVVGNVLGLCLLYAGLLMVSLWLGKTKVRGWAVGAFIAFLLSFGLVLIAESLVIALAAGPEGLPSFVARQAVSPDRNVIGVIYQHLSGLFGTFGLMLLGIGQWQSGMFKRMGLVVGVLALPLTVLGLFFGSVEGFILPPALVLAIWLLRVTSARAMRTEIISS